MTNETTPVVGDGATVCLYSDCLAATIIAVSKTGKQITVQEDSAHLLNGPKSGEPDALLVDVGGFAAHVSGEQRWATERNPQGRTFKATLRKDGKYRSGSSRVLIGVRAPHHDYNF